MGDPVPFEPVQSHIRGYGAKRVIVAFSGGVDSSVVLALSARVLTPQSVTAVTAISPSYPAGELDGARKVAEHLGVRHRIVETHEVERASYARNDAMRCFHCKTELFVTLSRLAIDAAPGTTVLAGANHDDASDFRPGLLAAEQFGVRNPLLETGTTKNAVRAIARALGLPNADKPALACLSSRIAFGIRISPALLQRIDQAEELVRSLGFDPVRVRHLGELARVEVPRADVDRLRGHAKWQNVVGALHQLGWPHVEIDPDGYRTGSMNATLG